MIFNVFKEFQFLQKFSPGFISTFISTVSERIIVHYPISNRYKNIVMKDELINTRAYHVKGNCHPLVSQLGRSHTLIQVLRKETSKTEEPHNHTNIKHLIKNKELK